MRKNIGISINNSKVDIGIVDERAQILAHDTFPMQIDIEPQKMMEIIIDELHKLVEREGIRLDNIYSIGMGVPGTVDSQTGLVQYCPNINWINVQAGMFLREKLGRPVIIGQDTRLAAWAEKLFGSARGYNNAACISVTGMGVGCGIVLEGNLFHGGMNTAGELGHVVIKPGGRQCKCGRKGCMEQYCSEDGIMASAQELLPDMMDRIANHQDVIALAEEGEERAVKLVDGFVDDLAFSIAILVDLVSPMIVLLNGELYENEKLIIEPLREKVYEKGYIAWSRKSDLKIEKAALGKDSLVIGGSAIYRCF